MAVLVLSGCASRGDSAARIGHDPFTDAQRVDVRPHTTDSGKNLKQYTISLGAYWDATEVDKARMEVLSTGPDYLNLSEVLFDIMDREGDRMERVNTSGIATTRFGESVRNPNTFLSVRSFGSDLELVTRVASAHSVTLLVNTPSGLLTRPVVRGGNSSRAFHAIRRFLAAVQQVGLDVDGFKYVRRPDPVPELAAPEVASEVVVAPLLDELGTAPLYSETDAIDVIGEIDIIDDDVTITGVTDVEDAAVEPGAPMAAHDEMIDSEIEEAEFELLDELEQIAEEGAESGDAVPAATPPLAVQTPLDDLFSPQPEPSSAAGKAAVSRRPSVPVVEGDAPVIAADEDLSLPGPQMTQAEMQARVEQSRSATLVAENERRRRDFERQLDVARSQNVREVILRDIELMISRDAERLIMKDARQIQQP